MSLRPRYAYAQRPAGAVVAAAAIEVAVAFGPLAAFRAVVMGLEGLSASSDTTRSASVWQRKLVPLPCWLESCSSGRRVHNHTMLRMPHPLRLMQRRIHGCSRKHG